MAREHLGAPGVVVLGGSCEIPISVSFFVIFLEVVFRRFCKCFIVILLFCLSLSVAHREPIVDWRQAAKGGLQTGVVDIPAEVQGLLAGEEEGEGDEEDKGDEGDKEDVEDEEDEEDKEDEEDEEADVHEGV